MTNRAILTRAICVVKAAKMAIRRGCSDSASTSVYHPYLEVRSTCYGPECRDVHSYRDDEIVGT